MGEFVRSASSTLEAPVVRRLREKLAGGNDSAGKRSTAPASVASAPVTSREAPVSRSAQPSAPVRPAAVAPTAPAQVAAEAPAKTSAPSTTSTTEPSGERASSAPTTRPATGVVPRAPGQGVPGPRTPAPGAGQASRPAARTDGRANGDGATSSAPSAAAPTGTPQAEAPQTRGTADPPVFGRSAARRSEPSGVGQPARRLPPSRAASSVPGPVPPSGRPRTRWLRSGGLRSCRLRTRRFRSEPRLSSSVGSVRPRQRSVPGRSALAARFERRPSGCRAGPAAEPQWHTASR